ncbi:MAG: hypothetical protein QOE55_326 [Acidobacteriaceae bacterium]|jgi:hypothetical protein|nr:hypothetical protein [Acidobacteriaceae bacterium]
METLVEGMSWKLLSRWHVLQAALHADAWKFPEKSSNSTANLVRKGRVAVYAHVAEYRVSV